jgi:hypothetical protein
MTSRKYRTTHAGVIHVRLVIYILAVTSALPYSATATPLAFGSNSYEFVQVPDPFTGTNNSWDTARLAAAVRIFNGKTGHLVTITSPAENDFVSGLISGQFSGFKGAWLGGKDGLGWVVGPEAGQGFGYTNWGGIEPNNSGYAYMNIGTALGGIAPGKWADDSGVQGVPDSSNDPVIGYFVEYEGTVLVGDYNNDGMVDAADFVVWRKNDGTGNLLLNDPIGGTIGPAQYNQWRTHFGLTSVSGAVVRANASVPEPATLFMLFTGLLALWSRRCAVASSAR